MLKDDQVDVSVMNHAGVKRPSLAQEAKEGILARSACPANPDSISNMEKGTTFAARARAAELNSVRAAKAAAAVTKDLVRSDEADWNSKEDAVPTISAVSLGSLKFTVHKRKNSGKASKPQIPDTSLNTASPEPELANPQENSVSDPTNISSEVDPVPNLTKALQSVTSSRQGSILDQQAIRQKVREVSARQQSIHNTPEDENHPHVLPSSASVSPYSDSESRINQTQGAKKAELNTHHIREVRREAEKQRDLAQSRTQTQFMSTHNGAFDENLRLGLGKTRFPVSQPLDATQYPFQSLPTEVGESSNSNMSFSTENQLHVPSSHCQSTHSDTNTSHQASFNLLGSVTSSNNQQPFASMAFQMPLIAPAEDTLSSQHTSSPTGTAKSSNDTSTPNPDITPAQLLATSPAFVPSNVGLGINLAPRQPRHPLPSVKGTERRQRSKHHNRIPCCAPATWDQSKGRMELAPASSNTKLIDAQTVQKFNEDAAKRQHRPHRSTINVPKKIILRDPMPYTNFTKKEQLYQQLQKTIDESTAKGDLNVSNRSVLFDPMASATTNSSKYGSTSAAGTSTVTTSSKLNIHGHTKEVSRFVFPQRNTLNAEVSDYDPDSLKDSDPLYPCAPPKKIETKDLSSSAEGYGYRKQPRVMSSASPAIPPGLYSNSSRFQEATVSNDDGFWNESLAIDSGNASVEDSMDNMASHATSNGIEQLSLITEGSQPVNLKTDTWIEEQRRLLLPKTTPTQAELDEEACKWFDSGKGVLEDNVKNLFHRQEGYLLSTGAKSLDNSEVEHMRTPSGSRHAPIGSERPFSSTSVRNSTPIATTKPSFSDEETRKRAAIDVMANVLSNLASYHGGENPGPGQHYSQPPAWCIDHTDAGRRSFFNDNWGDVPKRVGRDPRYQKTVHEGRTTYFEDPNSAGRREMPAYKVTPGWETPR